MGDNKAFIEGQEVKINGLASAAELNGLRAIVVRKEHSAKAAEAWAKARVPVFVIESKKIVSVKPENLTKDGPEPGEVKTHGELVGALQDVLQAEPSWKNTPSSMKDTWLAV